MKKIKTIFVTFSTLLMLNSCGSVIGDNRKGSDEFLVEKKAPLVLPPNFGELPEPGTKAKEDVAVAKENILSIEEMMGQNSSTDTNNNELNKSIEKSIIEKINEQ